MADAPDFARKADFAEGHAIGWNRLAGKGRQQRGGHGQIGGGFGDAESARDIQIDIIVAESDTTETVEGNVYFPEASLKREYFRNSTTTSTCPWKGLARYYNLLVDGQDNQDAAWYYPDPKPAARKIRGYVAFWRGVEIEK